jgi:ATP-binding cassette subfamily B protein
VALGFGAWSLFRLNDIAVAKSQIQIAKKIYIHIFNYIHHHSHQYFTDNFAGALFKRMNRYVRTFEDLSDTIFYRIISLLVHMCVTVIFVFFFSPLIGLIILLYVALFSVMSYYFVRWQHPLIVTHDKLDSELSGYVTDSIANHSTILSFGQFKNEFSLFRRKCTVAYDMLYRAWRRGNITSAFLGLVGFMSYWIVTGFALYLAIK